MANQSFGSVVLRHPRYDVEASISASYDSDPEKHSGAFIQTATLCVDTGCASLQFYATPHGLREVAAMLLSAADAVDAGVEAAQKVPA